MPKVIRRFSLQRKSGAQVIVCPGDTTFVNAAVTRTGIDLWGIVDPSNPEGSRFIYLMGEEENLPSPLSRNTYLTTLVDADGIKPLHLFISLGEILGKVEPCQA